MRDRAVGSIVPLKINEVVKRAGMADRPSYYSGLGASLVYLNSDILTTLHNQIEMIYDSHAAEAFVQMVSEIPKLAPTAFLRCLYALEANDWVWDRCCHRFSAVCLDERPSGRLQHDITMIAIEQLMIRDDTQAIRSKFLNRHGR